jgi:hypothetical protein
MACTEPQCLYKGALYRFYYRSPMSLFSLMLKDEFVVTKRIAFLMRN